MDSPGILSICTSTIEAALFVRKNQGDFPYQTLTVASDDLNTVESVPIAQLAPVSIVAYLLYFHAIKT